MHIIREPIRFQYYVYMQWYSLGVTVTEKLTSHRLHADLNLSHPHISPLFEYTCDFVLFFWSTIGRRVRHNLPEESGACPPSGSHLWRSDIWPGCSWLPSLALHLGKSVTRSKAHHTLMSGNNRLSYTDTKCCQSEFVYSISHAKYVTKKNSSQQLSSPLKFSSL